MSHSAPADAPVAATGSLRHPHSEMLAGFSDPVYDTLAVTECLREALAGPGRPNTLPGSVLAALLPPGLLPVGLAALLLGLLRADQPFWLGPREGPLRVRQWLGGCTGARPVDHPGQAVIAAIRAADADADLLAAMPGRAGANTPHGSTLLIEVPELLYAPPPPRREPGDMELMPRLTLCGEGVAGTRTFAAGGLSRQFWRTRAVRQAGANFGVDIVLVCGERLCAVPARTHVTLVP